MVIRHQGHIRIHKAGSEKRGESFDDPLAVKITGCIPHTDKAVIARDVLDGFLSVSESFIHVDCFGVVVPGRPGLLTRHGEVGPLFAG